MKKDVGYIVRIDYIKSPLVKRGGVPEWLNGAVSKTVVRENVPWVQIPPPPPNIDSCVLLVYKKPPRQTRFISVETVKFFDPKKINRLVLIWVDHEILNEMIRIQ